MFEGTLDHAWCECNHTKKFTEELFRSLDRDNNIETLLMLFLGWKFWDILSCKIIIIYKIYIY